MLNPLLSTSSPTRHALRTRTVLDSVGSKVSPIGSITCQEEFLSDNLTPHTPKTSIPVAADPVTHSAGSIFKVSLRSPINKHPVYHVMRRMPFLSLLLFLNLYGLPYRLVSRLLHRLDLHYAPEFGPIGPDGTYRKWCKWCGLRMSFQVSRPSPSRAPPLHGVSFPYAVNSLKGI